MSFATYKSDRYVALLLALLNKLETPVCIKTMQFLLSNTCFDYVRHE